jgi:hypothetical protein
MVILVRQEFSVVDLSEFSLNCRKDWLDERHNDLEGICISLKSQRHSWLWFLDCSGLVNQSSRDW